MRGESRGEQRDPSLSFCLIYLFILGILLCVECEVGSEEEEEKEEGREKAKKKKKKMEGASDTR